MWSKLSSALKRQEDNDISSQYPEQHHANASTRSLATSHHESTASLNHPSSPSKKKSMLKRLSRATNLDDVGGSSSSFRLPIGLPKRVKSQLNLNGNGSQASLSRGSTDARPSQDTLRSYQDPIPRESQDSLRSPMSTDFGSTRSILRDPKTPGTGQNVRFFSRDAYKVITPNQSMESETPGPISFMERLHNAASHDEPGPHPSYLPAEKSHGKRPSVTQIFAPTSQSIVNEDTKGLESSMMPVPPPDLTDIFDMSRDGELYPIPIAFNVPMLDSAVDMNDGDDQGFTSTPHKGMEENQTMYHSMGLSDVMEEEDKENSDPLLCAPTQPPRTRILERSSSFSFGQTVFHSLVAGGSSASSSEKSRLSDTSSIFKNRTRALSDGVFNRASVSSTPPEADISYDSCADVVICGQSSEPPDPFRANATTYYTPQTMIPPTPPQNSTHSRNASKEDDAVWSLRTQLALQQELCAQYEIDLGARDELVQTLTERCEKIEKEADRRKSVLRTWKKKVRELEKACRGLEEEVEKSREESFERSVMDEASGEALKCLQRRIETLEREKAGVQEEKEALARTIDAMKDEARSAGNCIHLESDSDDLIQLRTLLSTAKEDNDKDKERHRIAEIHWQEERDLLITRGAEVENSRMDLVAELTAAQEQLRQKDDEYGVLNTALEAQRARTESSGDEMQEIQKQRDGLREEVGALERRIGEMVVEWNESESRRTELKDKIQATLDIKETIEKEKNELEQYLAEERKHNSILSQALQEHERHLADLHSEREFADEKAARLEENVRQRDAEIADYSARVAEREIVAEQLREQMSNLKREHSCIVDQQTRKLEEINGVANDTREQMVRTKADADMTVGTLKERTSALEEEVDRLRRQVHELQQESADKEVKLVQLTKQRSQDKEDMHGLNIALDSKQQELELLKRKLGVKGTAGSTPVQPSKNVHRRDSSVFATPILRPPSALSDTGKDNARGTETPVKISKVLGKSVRANDSTSGSTLAKTSTGSMGPPPAKISRSSIGTPTPARNRLSSSTVRLSSTKPTSGLHRRASSTVLEQAKMKVLASGHTINDSPVPSELDEKENTAPVKVKRQASAVPVA